MTDHWQTVLKTHWDLAAHLSPLVGEYDQNFRACSDKGDYIFKVMREGCDEALVSLQIEAIKQALKHNPKLPLPQVIPSVDGAALSILEDETGTPRLCWLMQALPGSPYAKFRPHSEPLLHDLGKKTGQLAQALNGFSHPALVRDFKWNLLLGDWIDDHICSIGSPDRQAILTEVTAAFARIKEVFSALPRQAIHNDLNDYNLLVSSKQEPVPFISGIIDFGDMCAGPRIADLAIAAAYVVLDHPQPEAALVDLVRGYHGANPLTPTEVDLIWPLLRMRLAVSVVNSTLEARQTPDDPYVTVSQAPAWRFLEHTRVNAALLSARLRAACDLPVTDSAPRVMQWLDSERGNFAHLLGTDITAAPMGTLAVQNCAVPRNPFEMDLEEASRIGREYDKGGNIWLGYYGEPRLIYAEPAFRNGPWKASDRRTVHLAVDGFAPAGTPLFAPLDARVHHVEDRANHLDYGGVVILSHETADGDVFYTLYGHLDTEVCGRLRPGQALKKGESFARLGTPAQNGGWAPHVHFQLALATEGMGNDWPGVGDPDEMYLWRRLCPNPAPLLNLPDEKTEFKTCDRNQVHQDRKAGFGDNLKLSYEQPVMFLRGWRHHLFDEWGRPYLDAYNNVPHVGHAHPRIQAVIAEQLLRLNTNTRYLHPAQSDFADKLRSKLPAELSVCFFVNSGTEANELALRLARAATGAKGMVTPDHGYHGNTTGVMDISAYKFNAPGGHGKADWVELLDLPDDFKGPYRRNDPERAKKYACQVETAIQTLQDKGHGVAGFIAETFPSVGGQIVPPKGYLSGVYNRIRAAGGICIADEVQTALGRLGGHYFAFEHQGVVPDVVVLGKPIGNGHPLGVVVTTRAIAEAFAKGPEFFSTFGGSILSCRVGKEVLDIVDDEGLMENAHVMGERLFSGLHKIQAAHSIVGDVRGMGLFVGVELGTADRPATRTANYVVNRMRQRRILIGREGADDNVLKIRPPLTIEAEDVDMLLTVLDEVLLETRHLPDP